MKKVIVTKLIALTAMTCIAFAPANAAGTANMSASALAVAPWTTIKAQAAGKITNPTPINPNSNADFSGPWNKLDKYDTDCYKVVLPADGVFTTTLMARNAGDMAFVIRKDQTLDSRSELESASVFNHSVNSPLTSTKTVILSAGTYYITVTNKIGTLYGASKTPEYKVQTTYESFGFRETPDSYDSPKSMIIGNTYTDALTATDKEDWYKVSIPENGKYTLNYSSVQSRVDFRLKDMNLKEVAGKDCFEHENKTEDAFLEAGTYYLHVNGWASKYSVSINKAKIGNVSISKVNAARKKKVNVTFTTANGVAGYQIRYSTDKNFEKNVKIKTFNLNKAKIVNGNKRAYTISKLKKNKKYYFQIRAYVDRDNSRYYSDWSKVKKVKVK